MRKPMLLLLTSIILGGWFCCSVSTSAAENELATVAVLPFENLSKDANFNWLGCGFAETLATKLSNIATIQLVERAKLSQALDELKLNGTGLVDPKTAGKLGKIVGAKYVVIGSYQVAGNALKADVRRVEVETSIVSKGVDAIGEYSKVFDLQSELASKLASLLGKTPTEVESKAIAKPSSVSFMAYTLFVKGYEQGQNGDSESAIASYTQAIELDPEFYEAYYNRGNVYCQKTDYNRGIVDFDKAIAINPNVAEVYNNRGNAYCQKTDYNRGIVDFDKAIAINPYCFKAYAGRGTAYYLQNDYGRAIVDFRRAVEIKPDFADAHYGLGRTYEKLERYQEAVDAYTEAIRLKPDYVEARNALAFTTKTISAPAPVNTPIPLTQPVLVKSLPVGECRSVSFSPDGKTLVVAGGKSNKAVIWNIETGVAVQSFSGVSRDDFKSGSENKLLDGILKSPSVVGCTFSPDGHRILCDSPPALLLLDAQTGKRVRMFFSDLFGSQHAFTFDGQWLLYGEGLLGENAIKCFNLHTGEEIAMHTESCSGIAVSPDNKLLAACYGEDASAPHVSGTVEILDIPSGRLVRKITGSRAAINDVCFSPNDRYVVGSEINAKGNVARENSYQIPTGIVTIWDAASGAVVRYVSCSEMAPSGLHYSPDGTMIAVDLRQPGSYSINRTIKTAVGLYEAETGKQIAVLAGCFGFSSAGAQVFSPRSKLLAVPRDETVDIWQVK